MGRFSGHRSGAAKRKFGPGANTGPRGCWGLEPPAANVRPVCRQDYPLKR